MCYARILILQLICLSFVVVYAANGYTLNLEKNVRVRRQAKKNNKKDCDGFPCKSGECIDEGKECDGTVDCKDGSDETNSCHRIKCQSFLFRCGYGACINPDFECDGKTDCRDGSDESTPRCKRDVVPATCKDNEFKCNSGECISNELKCDGVVNCKDQSDETSALCWNFRCPGYTYKCAYGACVNGDAKCNGTIECFDGSDEDPNTCGTSIPTPTPTPTPLPPIITPSPPGPGGNKCVLPQHPQFGRWSVYGSNANFAPGNTVDPSTVLEITCKENFKLEQNSIVICGNNGQWKGEIGRCIATCPPLYSTHNMKVTCIYSNAEVENCTDAMDGTLARFNCAPFYEDLTLSRRPSLLCRDGSWDQQKPVCAPVCGQKSVNAQTLIINGTTVPIGDYPWQVAIYTADSKQLICGGSLLNQRVILTAAHCVTDPNTGKKNSKELYMVAVGKYYRKYDDPKDANNAQFSALEEMFIPEEYRGPIQNYLGDLAILVAKKTFVLSRRVQPVCVDWGLNYETRLVDKSTYGYVAGWGYTVENDKASDVLREVKVPAVSYDECNQGLPSDYEKYLTHDKLCAGYLDKGVSVCQGDSGGGLVFKYEGRYYITGIVSLSPLSPSVDGGCNSQVYGLYTRVSTYITRFIQPKEARYRP